MEKLCEYYDQQILLSEALYSIMSLKARNTLRKIDVISMKEWKEERLGIYTFDLSFGSHDFYAVSEEHEVGDLVKLPEFETINIESFQKKSGVEYMFTLDSDIVNLQSHIKEFNPIFRQAFKFYIIGDWENACNSIERCLELWDNDGPSKALKYYMQFYRFQQPVSWNGFRNIDKEIDMEAINKEQNIEEEEE